jgi:teichuronic acid biosynthesis glycosyltransferase TuaC
MRIVFFSTIFPRPRQPNLGIYCHHWCSGLVLSGHDVRVMSPRVWTERSGNGASEPKREFTTFDVIRPRYFHTPGMLHWAYGDFMWASVGRSLTRMISEFQADCVLSYWAHPDGEVAVRAAHKLGIPGAIIVGGSDALILPQADPARGRRISAALRSADAVISVSDQLACRVVELGALPGKSHVVLQGIDRDVFSPGDKCEARSRLNIPPTRPVLVCVGNLLPVKGIDILLDACALLHVTRPDFQLYLLGAGPSRNKLESQARRLGLDGHVSFFGAVPQATLADWYRAADLTVLSSRSEGIPNVLRESLACGTPFVATDVGGIHELAQPGWSRLVPPGSPDRLAQAIDAELAKSYTERPPVGSFLTWRESAGQIAAILRSAAGGVTPSNSGLSASML